MKQAHQKDKSKLQKDCAELEKCFRGANSELIKLKAELETMKALGKEQAAELERARAEGSKAKADLAMLDAELMESRAHAVTLKSELVAIKAQESKLSAQFEAAMKSASRKAVSDYKASQKFKNLLGRHVSGVFARGWNYAMKKISTEHPDLDLSGIVVSEDEGGTEGDIREAGAPDS